MPKPLRVLFVERIPDALISQRIGIAEDGRAMYAHFRGGHRHVGVGRTLQDAEMATIDWQSVTFPHDGQRLYDRLVGAFHESQMTNNWLAYLTRDVLMCPFASSDVIDDMMREELAVLLASANPRAREAAMLAISRVPAVSP